MREIEPGKRGYQNSVSDDARRARSGALGQRSDQQSAKESARALSTLPHAAGSAVPFGAALDHLPPALGGRRSLPRPVPVIARWRGFCSLKLLLVAVTLRGWRPGRALPSGFHGRWGSRSGLNLGRCGITPTFADITFTQLMCFGISVLCYLFRCRREACALTSPACVSPQAALAPRRSPAFRASTQSLRERARGGGEGCGYAASLGQRKRVAHIPTAEAARSGLILEGQRQARLHLKFNDPWSHEWGPVQGWFACTLTKRVTIAPWRQSWPPGLNL